MQTARKLWTKALSRWKEEQNSSCYVHVYSPLYCKPFSPISNPSWHIATTCKQRFRNITKVSSSLKADNSWHFLIFQDLLFCSFLFNFFVMLKVPAHRAIWIRTQLSHSPLHLECTDTVCIIHSYLNWLQFHSQTIVFWQKVSVSGLCLLQLSLQFSFILSTPFLEFTQFLLCILSTREQFQQQNTS